ncbi:MAG: hypothetical protein WA655_07590 [Candidatus Korobacteraceae bacterium]
MNIEEVEGQISHNLSSGLSLQDSLDKVGYAVPQQSQPRVTLSDANGRKKKRNASADNWSVDSGQIVVRYEPVPQEPLQKAPQRGQQAENVLPEGSPAQAIRSNTFMHPSEAELLKALERAESKPGWHFVPLKKFRDEILPAEPLIHNRTDSERRETLHRVIEKRFVLRNTIANPKSPQFPVTTIRLNRLLPEVKAILGNSGNTDMDFSPIEISGEPLSATVLRERR